MAFHSVLMELGLLFPEDLGKWDGSSFHLNTPVILMLFSPPLTPKHTAESIWPIYPLPAK